MWNKLLSKQRKRAVVACFRMAPLYNLPRCIMVFMCCDITCIDWSTTNAKQSFLSFCLFLYFLSFFLFMSHMCFYFPLYHCRHRAVNLFLLGYSKAWIEAEGHSFEDKLIEDLTVSKLIVFILHNPTKSINQNFISL